MDKDAMMDFERFMKHRLVAAQAYVCGDSVPLSGIVSHQSPTATLFGPKGDYTEGTEAVANTYARDAKSFEPGSQTTFEVLQMEAGNDIAYWVGIQRAVTRLRGSPEPVKFNLRVTELFHREGDSWKMVHRHADPLQL